MDLFCTGCGRQRVVGQRFCGGCGGSLDTPPPMSGSATPAAQRAPVIPPQPAVSGGAPAGAPPSSDVSSTIAKPWLAQEAAGARPAYASDARAIAPAMVPQAGYGADQLGQLLRRPPIERALMLAGAVTLIAVFAGAVDYQLRLPLYGLSYAVAIAALGAAVAAVIPRLIPHSKISSAAMAGITAGLAVATLIVNEVVVSADMLSLAVLAGLSGAMAGFLVGCPFLFGGRQSPLVIAAIPAGLVAGILGRIVAESLSLWQYGIGPVNLFGVVQSAAVFGPAVVLGCLGWEHVPAGHQRAGARSAAGGADGPPSATSADGTNGLAIGSLVCSLFCFSLPAVVMGHIALSQIKATGGRQGGRGMAIAGLILGYAAAAITLAYFVLVFIFAVRVSTMMP